MIDVRFGINLTYGMRTTARYLHILDRPDTHPHSNQKRTTAQCTVYGSESSIHRSIAVNIHTPYHAYIYQHTHKSTHTHHQYQHTVPTQHSAIHSPSDTHVTQHIAQHPRTRQSDLLLPHDVMTSFRISPQSHLPPTPSFYTSGSFL